MKPKCLIMAIFLIGFINMLNAQKFKTARDSIKSLIEYAYIDGIHSSQDLEKINSGFHEDFIMNVYHGDKIVKVNVEQWLKRIDKLKGENPELWNNKTIYTVEFIDVTANAASIKLKVYKGEIFFSTDYMLLYKFSDGWKIVSKIYTILE